MKTIDCTLLTPDEIDKAQRRIERFFGLERDDLTSDEQAERRRPEPYETQDSSQWIAEVEMVMSARDQVLYDLWGLIRTAKAARR